MNLNPLTWGKKSKNASDEMINVTQNFDSSENIEILAIRTASKTIDGVISSLEAGENDIQAIYDAAEKGVLTNNLIEDMTNELTAIEKERHAIIQCIDGVIDAAKEAVRIESVIRFTAEKSKLEKSELKKLRLLDAGEHKILSDAEDMKKGVNKLILTISEILELNPANFRNDSMNMAKKLRVKKSAMDVGLLKIKSDMAEINVIIKDVVLLSNVAHEIGLELGPALDNAVTELTGKPIVRAPLSEDEKVKRQIIRDIAAGNVTDSEGNRVVKVNQSTKILRDEEEGNRKTG